MAKTLVKTTIKGANKIVGKAGTTEFEVNFDERVMTLLTDKPEELSIRTYGEAEMTYAVVEANQQEPGR